MSARDGGTNFEGGVQDARFMFWLGLKVAHGDEMPRWNAGDEFEAARKKALAEVPPSR